MADNKKKNGWGGTIFQNLKKVINGWDNSTYPIINNTNTNNTLPNNDDIIYRGDSKSEYERAKVEAKQNNYLKGAWINAIRRNSMKEYQSMNLIELMYRDVELMSTRPSIYQALSIISNSTCTIGHNGSLINISSTSPRIKSVLEDLFVNRLQIHMELLPLVRTMIKYGNCFQLLNIDNKNGVMGWKMLPVTEVKRFSGNYPYGTNGYLPGSINSDNNVNETHFELIGAGTPQKFQSWQIAHFRLLNDTIALPYGMTILNGARQHWRRLTMMEDMMLIYMLNKSYERFVFKVDVGAIDQADVQPYMQEIVNNLKRVYKIDRQTGMLDLQENFLSAVDDLFIPVRGNNDGTKIETLQGGGNIDKIKEMLEYVNLEMFTALGVPKIFLNFEASPAEGRNMALTDMRYAQMITRVQQCVIMTLNQIAITHLYLQGFEDNLNDFTITMNGCSTQAEIQRVEELQKKILTCKDAVQNATDTGLPIFSWKKALKEIMKFSDDEIQDILNDLRLEKAISTELSLTQQKIKETGFFEKIDNIYGEPGAKYDFSVTEMGATTDASSSESSFGGGNEFAEEIPSAGEEEIPSAGEEGTESGGETPFEG